MIRRVNPDCLSRPTGGLNAHLVISSGRLVHVNGMIARDIDHEIVGIGDHDAQARKAWENLRDALAAIGATGHDIVYYRVNVVDATPEIGGRIMEIGREVFRDAWPICGAILVGVTMLGRGDLLVELEATAVLDDTAVLEATAVLDDTAVLPELLR